MADADDDAFLYGDDTNGSATGDAAQLAGMLASHLFTKFQVRHVCIGPCVSVEKSTKTRISTYKRTRRKPDTFAICFVAFGHIDFRLFQ